jgi:ABC-type sugar transport system permease subunit
MRGTKLLAKLTIYYALIALVVIGAIKLWPSVTGWLPIGGVEQLISQPAKNPLQASEAVRAAHVNNLGQSLFWLAVALVSALLLSLPVSWVYMGIRNDDEYDQSLINTIIVLPMVVTGIVIIVQNSLALAFSLAGIAGAVRFRNSLKSSGDALFILLAVAIGLSAGIGAVELAALVTMAFNYTFVGLWMSEYGERAGMKRFLSDYNPNTHPDAVGVAAVVVEGEKKP